MLGYSKDALALEVELGWIRRIMGMGKSRPLGRTTTTIFISLSCAVAFLCITALSASAATFCVGPVAMTGCPAGVTPDGTGDLQAAIDATISNGTGLPADSIYIAPGTYGSTTGWSTANSRVKLIGASASKPVLTISGPGSHDHLTVLKATSNSVTYENLSIVLPAADGVTGISDGAASIEISNVDITGPGSTNAIGTTLGSSGPTVENSSITLPHAVSGNNSIGISGIGSTSIIVRDTSISARTGVSLSHLQKAALQRLTIKAPQGVQLIDSPAAVISSSLIAPAAVADGETDGFSVATVVDDGTAPTTSYPAPLISNCTLIGVPGSSSSGVVASVPIGSGSAQVDLDSSVIYGHDAAVSTSNGSGAAAVNATYTRYAGSADGGFSAGTATSALSGDPGFASAGGDFTLQRASALVDAGNPAALPDNTSAADLLGNPRVVSRGSGNVRDIGAYELQNRAPEARITIATPVPSTTAAIAFSGAASSDADGDAISFAWKFDNGSFMNGQVVNKLLTIEGPHTVQLTVTDQTGVSTTSSSQFDIAKGFLNLKLRSQNVRADSRGGFSITMSCPDAAASNCTGRLAFQTTKKIEAKNFQDTPRTNAAKAMVLRAANYVFSIEPGTTRKLRIQTYGTFQNVLKKKKKFTLSATMLNGSTSNSTLVSNTPRFVLSAPRAKKKR